MHLIEPLAAGMAGAEGGSCRVYQRGTVTAATVYSDFVGASVAAGTAGLHTLSSLGRIILYANEIVDVVVYDSVGATVTSFTNGMTGNTLDAIHANFTGTDYTSGVVAVNKPVRLNTLLTAIYTSFGSNDFYVLVNGSPVLLKNAISAVGLQVYNVKSSTYGAVGDGTTDDTAAIAAALTAATAAGGAVFFPPGVYRITSTLTLPINVSLWGCGPGTSVLAMDHASNDWITASGTSVYRSQVRGLRFKALQACSGQNFEDTVGLMLIDFEDCEFAESTGILVKVAKTARLNFSQCVFKPGSSTSDCFSSTATTGSGLAKFERCTFIAPTGAYNTTNAMVYGNRTRLVNCTFDMSLMSSGTAICVDPRGSEAGCAQGDFVAQGGGTVTAFKLSTAMSVATDQFYESGNRFGIGITPCDTPAEVGSIQLGSRVGRWLLVNSTGSGLTLANTRDYDTIFVNHTNTSGVAITITSATMATPSPGSRLQIVVLNNATGAGRSVSFNTTYFRGTTVTVTDTQYGTWNFVWAPSTLTGGGKWVQVADEADVV